MKKANMGMALFTGLFVFMIVFLSEIFIPDKSFAFSVTIAATSALVGGLIGNKLFPKEG
jgi:hypothetical protein